MAGLDEIGKLPQEVRTQIDKPTGINLFFGNKEAAFFTNAGREITEGVLKESFLLYRMDLKRTQTDFYGQAKKKEYFPPIQIFGRINVEAEDSKLQVNGNIEKKGMGKLTAEIYLSQLETLGLIEKTNGTGIMVTKINQGDFLHYRSQFYKVVNNGFSQTIANEFGMAGDRALWIRITAIQVDNDIFHAR